LRSRWPTLVIGGAILASAVLILHLGRNQTLVVDQWGYLFAYRSWAPNSLLFPHNGHLIVLPLLVYKAMYGTFGIESQLPYQLVNIALSSTIAVLLFVLIRDRVGDLVALASAILMLFYGAGADVIVPTYQYPNLIGMASGLGMMLALRRPDRRADLTACLLLAMSLASFTIGIAFAAGATTMLAFRPAGRRLRSAWVVLAPLVAYGAWVLWARKFGQETLYVHNLKVLGSATADQLSAVLSGLTGLFATPNAVSGPDTVPIRTDWGPALVVGLAALLIVRLPRSPRPTPEAIAAVVVLLSYFLLVGIALNMFRNTFDTRLVYLGSVLTLLAVAELCAPYRPGPIALATLGIAFVFAMCANVAELGDSAKFLREESASNRAKLAAVEIADGMADDVPIEEPPGDMAFYISSWNDLKEEVGSPGYTESELKAAPPAAREDADAELVRILGIAPRSIEALSSMSSRASVEVSSVSQGIVRQRRSCASLLPVHGRTMIAVLRTPPGGIVYSSRGGNAAVTVGRFADATNVELPTPSGAIELRIPPDRSPVPWVASMRTDRPTLLCPVGHSP
jgi:hypothetical protein